MYKYFAKISFVTVVCLIFSACERNAPSPVEIKIDDAVGGTHTVWGNETIYDIAYRYNIDPMNLAKINNLQPPYTLKNGQVLQLPDNSSNNQIITNTANTNTSNQEGINADTQNIGYVALEDNPKEGDIFADQTEENTSGKSKKEIDDDFDSVVLAEPKKAEKTAVNSVKKSKDAASSVKSVKDLSTPKVTATATGTPVSTKSEKSTGNSAEKSKKTTSNSEKSNSTKMRMPVNGKIISHYGDINDGIANDGINIKAKKGTDVVAAADGTVIYVGNKLDEEYGNVVIVQHDNGLITSYAHLDGATVKKDAKIHAGDKLGTVGQTGDVSEPQLYFEVMKNKKPVNPSKYLKK